MDKQEQLSEAVGKLMRAGVYVHWLSEHELALECVYCSDAMVLTDNEVIALVNTAESRAEVARRKAFRKYVNSAVMLKQMGGDGYGKATKAANA